MTLLDEVRKMKTGGYTDVQIIQAFQDQGISPREINDALSRSKIKEAVSSEFPPSSEYDQSMQGMQPSMINQNPEEQSQYMPQFPQPEQYSQNYPEMPQQGQYAVEGNQDFSQPQYPEMQQQMDYGAYYGINAETMGEIANQVVSEKLIKTQKTISDLNEFKIVFEAKVDKIDQRLQRIELIIDQLQSGLIKKSSLHYQDIEDIKTELKGMQGSFSKILNPLADTMREVEALKDKRQKTEIKTTVKKSRK